MHCISEKQHNTIVPPNNKEADLWRKFATLLLNERETFDPPRSPRPGLRGLGWAHSIDPMDSLPISSQLKHSPIVYILPFFE